MISVLIPTYNCGPWLRESLDSIFAQTHRDMEVVVVDDGSTDDTPQVLAAYAGRLTVVPGRHQGLSAARNLCLAHARGDWIAFHDADDVALPDRLASHLAYLEAHPAYDAVFCNGERMDGAGRVVPASIAQRVAGHRLTARDLFIGYPVYLQGALAPRRAFESAGQFDARFPVQPDIEYGYRLFRHCRATFVDRVMFRYRWHTTNNSRDRLGGREDIARILDGLDAESEREIGAKRLRARLARHYYRIAQRRLERGQHTEARAAVTLAVALRPLHPQYRLLGWRIPG